MKTFLSLALVVLIASPALAAEPMGPPAPTDTWRTGEVYPHKPLKKEKPESFFSGYNVTTGVLGAGVVWSDAHYSAQCLGLTRDVATPLPNNQTLIQTYGCYERNDYSGNKNLSEGKFVARGAAVTGGVWLTAYLFRRSHSPTLRLLGKIAMPALIGVKGYLTIDAIQKANKIRNMP